MSSLAKYIGRTYEEYNCFELVKEFYKDQFQLELRDYFDGPVPSRKEAAFLIVSNKGEFEKVTKPIFGDIIVIKLYGYACHIGVCLDSRKFIHSARGSGSCMDTISRYENMTEGFYRHRERAQ